MTDASVPDAPPPPSTPGWGARLLRIPLAYVHPGALGCLGLVVLGLALDWLALPPGPFPYAILVADVPFLLLLWKDGGRRWKRWAFLYGALHYGFATRWLVEVHVGQVPTLMVILGPIYVILGGMIRWFVRGGVPYVLAVGLGVVFEELLRTWWMGGMPWPARSLSFAAGSGLDVFLPAASLLGAYGLSFLAGTTSAVVSGIPRCLTAPEAERAFLRRRVAVAALFPLFVALVLGYVAYDRGNAFEVAQREGRAWQTYEELLVVQGNISQSLKHKRKGEGGENASETIFRRHLDITKAGMAADRENEVFGILWPETMLPFPLVSPGVAARFPGQWQSYVNVVTRMKREVPEARDATWLIGAIHLFEREGDPPFAQLFDHGTYDSLFQLEPQFAPEPGGAAPRPRPEDPNWFPPWERARHDKVVLVPGGEYTPLGEVFPVLRLARNFVSVIPELDPGLYEQKPMRIWEGQRWSMRDRQARTRKLEAGTVICFELAFPARCRYWRRAGAHVLINAANYGWFGKTSFRAQIRALARLRAAELAMGVVMAGNTGPTLFFDPLGRPYGRFHGMKGEGDEPAGADGTTHRSGWVSAKLWADNSVTPYTAWGDLPFTGLLIVLSVFAWARGRALRRAAEAAGAGN
ncbi:MAG: apolipoprotein N-acyltransferase [Planctomycetota bacterium]|nr:apolipoprotein N-acyltransferase [Planctomycetota bacterium]